MAERLRYRDLIKGKRMFSATGEVNGIYSILTKLQAYKRKREGERERERQAETETERQRQTETESDRQTDTETDSFTLPSRGSQ